MNSISSFVKNLFSKPAEPETPAEPADYSEPELRDIRDLDKLARRSGEFVDSGAVYTESDVYNLLVEIHEQAHRRERELEERKPIPGNVLINGIRLWWRQK